MLGHLRKVQKSVLIVLTAIICIAFAYLYNRYDTGAEQGPSSVAFTLEGRPYHGSEAYRLANLFHVALRDLGISPPFSVQPMGRFALDILGDQSGMAMFNPNIDRTDFVINLLEFRSAAKRLGVAATEEQIQKAIESISLFHDDGGKFDPVRYRNYLRNGLSRFALYEFDLRELIADFVNYETIKTLTGAGLGVSQWEVDRAYKVRYETFTAYEIFLKAEAFAKDLKVTDDQIRKYYDENKASFQSEPRRAIRYLKFSIPPKGEKEAEDQWQARRNVEANRFRQAFKTVRGAIEENGKSLSEAIALLQSTEGFKQLKPAETAPFPASAPPSDLEGGSQFADRIFNLDEKDPNAFDTVATDTAIYLYWLKEAPVPAAQLSLEEAKAEVRKRLEAQDKDAKLTAAADKVRKQLAELLGKGKTIIEAAKSAGVEAKAVKPFDRDANPEGTGNASAVKAQALELVPGQLSEPSMQPDGALLVYLAARDVPKRDSEPEDRKRLSEEMSGAAASSGFEAWFAARRAGTQLNRPMVKDRDGNSVPLSIEAFAPRR
jgi:peptidyl-prolyl cis-trans isomerase D